MAKGEFDILYLCAGGGGGAMIFSFVKSTSFEGGGESEKKNPEMIRGASKNERKK